MVSLTLIHQGADSDRRNSSAALSTSHDRIAEGLLFTQIIGATFLQKLAIPLGGDTQIYFALLVMLGTAAAGFILRRLSISGARLSLFLLMAAGLTLTQLFEDQEFSVSSLLLLIVAHLPYIFRLSPEYATRPGVELEFFQKCMVVLAVLGIVQFAGQHYMPRQYLFPLDTMLPQSLVFQGFHGLNPISVYYKSTGIFALEPAIFSQMLALAVIIEIIRRGSWLRGALYLIALYFTYSGTGLMMLGILVPIILLYRRQYGWFALLFVGGLAALLTKMGPDQIARLAEFSNTETSAYARFISIFRLIHDVLWDQTQSFFFGMGAGSIKYTVGHFNYALHDPSWGKIIYEYGLVGLLVYFPLLIAVFAAARCSRALKAALAIQFLFLGEYVLSPTVHGLVLSFLAWPSGQPRNQKQ